MAEHLSQETLTRYEGRALSPAELLAADDHLAACTACRERLEGRNGEARAAIVESLSAESAATPLTHLDYEQLEAIVDGTADEDTRETVISHTAVCAACAAELNELMALKDQLQARGEWRREGESAPVVSLNEYQERRASQRKARINWPRWAAAAAAVVVCALVAWLALRPSPPTKVASSDQNHAATASANSNQQAEANRNAAPGITESVTPAAVVALNDGARRVTLDAEGRLEGFERLAPPEAADAVRVTLERQTVIAPRWLTTITENAGTLMSGASEGISFKLVSPIGTAVESTRPVFRWQPLDGATSYVVKIFDADFNRVAASESLTTTTWTPPQPLAAGSLYSWQVTATKDGNEVTSPVPPAPQARFKVIERARLAELRRIAQSYPDSHLLRGVLYVRAGLLDDAERELQALLKANPTSEAAKRLLASVRALRQKK